MDLFGDEPKPVRETWDKFKVNDDDRAYCVDRWSLLYLADAFVSEVIEHYTTEGSKRVKNKHLALRRWIQRASPSGRYYEAGPWERRCEQARRYKAPDSRSGVSKSIVSDQPARQMPSGSPDRASTWKPTTVAKDNMRSIQELLTTQNGKNV